MKYAVLTFGCKVNQYESSAINSAMIAAGHEPCAEDESPDIVIVNSCTVTENSDKKACHAIRAAKKRNSGVITVLAGCYPQAFPEEAGKCSADIIIGNVNKTKIPELIAGYMDDGKVSAEMVLPREYEDVPFSYSADKTRAFIKIEDGCDRFCSYCAIPYARGRVRSRELGSIGREACICAENGHKEIVLVGINLTCYGTDTGLDLADAVEAASAPDGIERVRLSSLEPEMLDDRLISRLAACKKLCPHFHLSLQSGCDATLRRMNRHYDTAEYLGIIGRLRENFPDCAITTDIMVGFAGETDDEFAESLAFAEKAGFARIHVFTYSVRKGTAAAKRNDFVPEATKAERYAEMSTVAEKVHAGFLRSQIGKCVEILVQKRTSPDYAEGLTPNYTPVRIYGSDAHRHDIIRIRITGAGDGYCTGEAL